MAVEIERKFLVVGDDWRAQTQRSQRLVQGYLTTGRSPSGSQARDGRKRPTASARGVRREAMDEQVKPHPGVAEAACSVRVRIGGERAWLSIKSAIAGIERREYEYAIPPADAEQMIAEFCPGVVE